MLVATLDYVGEVEAFGGGEVGYGSVSAVV